MSACAESARGIASIFLAAVLVAGCASTPAPIDADMAIVDVSVVPMTGEIVVPHQTVAVKSGRIVAVDAAAAVRVSDAALRIDGRGKFLAPGLADMHVHFWSDAELSLYVANGVTLVRNMWGNADTLARRQRIANGTTIGPRLVTAGPLTDGDPPVWSQASVAHDGAEACTLMTTEQQQGYDFFKIYNNIGSETFDGIVACSQRLGYPFAGHVPEAVGMERMIRGHARSIEHLTGYDDADRKAGGPYRARGDYPDFSSRSRDRVALARRVQDGELAWSDVFDPQRRAALATLAAQEQVWSVPTLIVNKNIRTTRAGAAAQLGRPEMRYVDPLTRASWNPDFDFRLKSLSDADLALLTNYFSEDLARVRALHRAGAPLLVGTDAPNPFVVHGFAVHDELQLLVQAGLSPYEALSAATRLPAEFLGEIGQWGTVETGRRADLVLLDGNPLVDIGATRRIAGVVLAGRWLPARELQRMLDDVAAAYAIPDDWFAGVPLPNDVGSATRMTWHCNGVEIGAERFTIAAEHDGTVLQAQSSGRDGNNFVESLVLRSAPDGTFVSLEYRREQAGATTTARLHRTGVGLTLDGASADGSRIASSASVTGPVLVSCSLTSCLVPITRILQSLAPGESRGYSAVALDIFPALAAYPEQWTLTRDPDPQQQVVRLKAARGKATREVRVKLDDAGIRQVVSDGDVGVLETSREGH